MIASTQKVPKLTLIFNISTLMVCSCLFMTGVVMAKELRLAHFMPPVHTLHQKVFLPLAEELKAATGGGLTIRIYPAGTLGKGPVQQYKRVLQGVADITFGLQNYTAQLFPRSLLITRPGIATSAEDGTRKFWDLYETHFKIEYREVKLLGVWVMSPTALMTRKIPVRTLGDLHGLKVRISSPIESELIQAWGGVPVAMPITESYNALSTGVVDAVLIQPSALYRPWNLSEPARYITDNLPSPTSIVYLAMNQQVWQALPKDQQAILDQLTGREFSIRASKLWSVKDVEALEQTRQGNAGTEYIRLTPEQRQVFARAARPTVDKALDKLHEAGIDGRIIYKVLQP